MNDLICLECHLNPDKSWMILDNKFGFNFHLGADFHPCGPIESVFELDSETLAMYNLDRGDHQRNRVIRNPVDGSYSTE